MKLIEIASTPKNRFTLNKNTSVSFSNDSEMTPPNPDAQGKWHFFDKAGSFDQFVQGKFKDSVKRATDSHKHLLGSFFSHSLIVLKSR